MSFWEWGLATRCKADLGENAGPANGYGAYRARRATAAERERLLPVLKLLEVAVCPAKAIGCDGKGIPHQVGEDEWEQEQCQWCHERTAAIREGDRWKKNTSAMKT